MKQILLAAVILLTSCSLFEPEDKSRQIYYKVLGDCGSADVTYEYQGSTQQESNIYPGDWVKSYKAEKGDFVYISAQNQNKAGTVTVEIYVDNKLFKTATSTGAYVIASASGSAE